FYALQLLLFHGNIKYSGLFIAMVEDNLVILNFSVFLVILCNLLRGKFIGVFIVFFALNDMILCSPAFITSYRFYLLPAVNFYMDYGPEHFHPYMNGGQLLTMLTGYINATIKNSQLLPEIAI